jgi:hypothetical protein
MEAEDLFEKARRNTRTYEITWSDGSRQRLTATQVHTGGHTGHGQRSNVIEFMGSMGLANGTGWAGRLLLTGVMSTGPGGIVSVRDVGVEMPFVSVSPQRRRWRGRMRVR